jgi:DNA-binding transcriptional regulator YbjK
MVFRPSTHREATLARRRALLDAAIAVIGERGLGGTTHRAVAARAGLPLATTSYFFASLDELVTCALQELSEQTIRRMETITALVTEGRLSPAAAVERFAAFLLAIPSAQIGAQFEVYLEIRRRPALAHEARRLLLAFEELAARALEAAGVDHSREAARSIVALADGFALQRLTMPRGIEDHRALRHGLHALLFAFGAQAPALKRRDAR